MTLLVSSAVKIAPVNTTYTCKQGGPVPFFPIIMIGRIRVEVLVVCPVRKIKIQVQLMADQIRFLIKIKVKGVDLSPGYAGDHGEENEKKKGTRNRKRHKSEI